MENTRLQKVRSNYQIYIIAEKKDKLIIEPL